MKHLLIIISLSLISIYSFGQGSIILKTARTKGGSEVACQSISLKPGFSFSATANNSLTLIADPSSCNPYGGATDNFSTNQNYILTRTYTKEDGSRYLDQVQYFDGLGRPIQTVQRGITPDTRDLVSIQEYDTFGRESNVWLPGKVTTANNGAFVAVDAVKGYSKSSNLNDSKPYSYPVYEASPLNRVLKQIGPGSNWQGSDNSTAKGIETAYKTNSTSDSKLNCKLYTVGGTKQNPTLSTSVSNYSNGQLYVTELKDEDGNVSYEFKDKLEQVVLIRQMEGTTTYDTYYIYNDFGNLCFVLPPRIQDDGLKLDELAYQYKYDNRNRCIAKKLPGCDWIYYVYDKADRLIFTQDGEQRVKGEYAFSIPDVFGRVVLTGTCTNKFDYTANTLANVVVKAEYPQTGTGVYMGYNISGVTLATGYKILSANYYDNYKYRTLAGFSNTGLAYETSGVEGIYLKRYGDDTSANEYKHKGLLTGTATAILDGSTTTTYLYSCMYYDNKKQLIQVKSTNHLSGVEKEYIAYNFTGQPTRKKHIHTAAGKNTLTEAYAYSYDHAGRLLNITHQLTDGTKLRPQIVLAQNTYDDFGRIKTNKKGGQSNLNTSYAYNIRSWTSSITNTHFKETLAYTYNGNISQMEWAQADKTRKYNFAYDNLSRLKSATYTGDGNFSTAYTYDKHGNMLTLKRYGMTTVSPLGYLVDDLTMTYTGNQLKTANDNIGDIAMSASKDFKDYSKAAIEYTYNKNGAMTQDLNKGITKIAYNSLNLPQTIDIKNKTTEGRNSYTYSASGQKLRAMQLPNPNYSTSPLVGSTINTYALAEFTKTDYAGNKIYENDGLKRILVDGGYYEGGIYYFYITDHLGNNRVVTDAAASVVQSTHYYPFGSSFADATAVGAQPYKYNGKELDTRNGLDLYDYSARYYESTIGRFTTVDPMAEKYYSISPYAYVANNPLKYIDPTGMWIYIYYEGSSYKYNDGKLYARGDDGKYQNEYTVENESTLGGIVNGLRNLSEKSSTGSLVVDYFSNEDKDINIMSLSKDQASKLNMKYENQYDYDNNIIYMKDDLSGSSVPTQKGIQDSPFWLDLGHELAHGVDQNTRGAADMKFPWVMISDQYENISSSEKIATHYENMMRSEARLPLRTHYATQKGVPYTPSWILYNNGIGRYSGMDYNGRFRANTSKIRK